MVFPVITFHEHDSQVTYALTSPSRYKNSYCKQSSSTYYYTMQYAKSNAYADEFDVDCMVWSLRLWGSSLQAVLGVAKDKHNSRPQKHSAHIVSCGECHDAS